MGDLEKCPEIPANGITNELLGLVGLWYKE